MYSIQQIRSEACSTMKTRARRRRRRQECLSWGRTTIIRWPRGQMQIKAGRILVSWRIEFSKQPPQPSKMEQGACLGTPIRVPAAFVFVGSPSVHFMAVPVHCHSSSINAGHLQSWLGLWNGPPSSSNGGLDYSYFGSQHSLQVAAGSIMSFP